MADVVRREVGFEMSIHDSLRQEGDLLLLDHASPESRAREELRGWLCAKEQMIS